MTRHYWQQVLATQFKDRIPGYNQRVDDALDDALPRRRTKPERLHDAMRYAVFNGGKRVRPLLVYAAGECLGVDQDLLDSPAVAIELIHAFSLVHDDLPAMDDDELRRGKPTVHVAYDEATAILAADALQPLAFNVLSKTPGVSPAVRLSLIELISGACGSLGMTGGQSIDLAAEGQVLSAAEIEHMYALKTGALIHAAIMSACLLSPGVSAEQREALDGFGRDVGIAFQVKDDLLDVEGNTAVIGKPAGSDERLQKATYPGLFGVERARQRCDELLAQGMARLDVLGERAGPLRWLAGYIVSRGK